MAAELLKGQKEVKKPILQNKITLFELFRHLKLKIIDTFLFITLHQHRHIHQAERCKNAASDKK
jgi:hypothetical protein